VVSLTTLKKTFGVFFIGILISVFGFYIEYLIKDIENENEDVELASFLKDYLDVKGNLILLLFLVLAPISLYLSYTSIKAKDKITSILIFATGYGWFVFVIMIIEDFGIYQFPN